MVVTVWSCMDFGMGEGRQVRADTRYLALVFLTKEQSTLGIQLYITHSVFWNLGVRFEEVFDSESPTLGTRLCDTSGYQIVFSRGVAGALSRLPD